MKHSKWSISFHQHIMYDIVKCSSVFALTNNTLALIGKGAGSNRFIVLDHNIYNLYKQNIIDYFQYYEISIKIVKFQSGEKSKSIQSLLDLLQEIDNFPILRRDEPIIAIGGGVLMDVVGFAASIYRRGVSYIRIPTSVMGYVDGALGIKTGINFNYNKNRLGTFAPPKKVLLDSQLLNTLPHRHVLNGLAEIIKIAIIKDVTLFKLLENQLMSIIKNNVISCECLDKAITTLKEELEPNLYEDNLERAADFGHTFSLAYEMHCDILHGEAVIIDILLSIFLAYVKQILEEKDIKRILTFIGQLNYPKIINFVSVDILWDTVIERTYHRNGLQRIPLPRTIGTHVFVNDITKQQLSQSYQLLNQWEQSL